MINDSRDLKQSMQRIMLFSGASMVGAIVLWSVGHIVEKKQS